VDGNTNESLFEKRFRAKARTDVWGCRKSPLWTLVGPWCDFVVKNKALNHKGSQSSSQSNPKVKSIKIPLFKQPLSID
jgi:hypothetical protein